MISYVIVPVGKVTRPNGTLYTAFSWIFYLTNGTLIFCHAFTLYHAKKRIYSAFSIQMITLYLLFNVFSFLEVLTYTEFVYPASG